MSDYLKIKCRLTGDPFFPCLVYTILTKEITINLSRTEKLNAFTSIRVVDHEYSFVNFGTDNYCFIKKKNNKAKIKS